MRLIIFSTLLTLVLSAQQVSARPHDKVDPTKNSGSDANAEKIEKVDLDKENILLTAPNKLAPVAKKEYYYPYMQSISPRLGLAIDIDEFSNAEDKGDALTWLLGFNYLVPRYRSPQYEVGIDISDDSYGYFHFSKRWIVNERSSFRPYYKLGASLQIIGEEGIATATNIDNYFLSGSVGIEDFLKAPMSLRIDLQTMVGNGVIYLVFSMGYSWAW